MKTLVISLVIASAAVIQGFVKGGYSEPSPIVSVPYVNRDVQNQAGSLTIPAVSLKVNGAHTLAGEVILHHVIYNGNGAPVIAPGMPIGRGSGGLPYEEFSQFIQLHSGGRNLNRVGIALPANGADLVAQFLTPNGLPENKPGVHISPPGPVYQINSQGHLGVPSDSINSPSMIFSHHPLKQSLQAHQLIQTRPQIFQQPQQQFQIQQQRFQPQPTQISQIQQRPGQTTSQQIVQPQQQQQQIRTRKPNGMSGLNPSEVNGDRSGRLPGMPTLAEINSQLNGINGSSAKTV